MKAFSGVNSKDREERITAEFEDTNRFFKTYGRLDLHS